MNMDIAVIIIKSALTENHNQYYYETLLEKYSYK